jgi:hypothetical protein
MNWYYADGTKQVGPLADDDFANLVQAEIIKPETLVWHEGLPSWQPYREVSGAPTPPPSTLPPVMPAGVTPEQVVAREYEVDIGDCLNRSWEQYKTNFGVVLGATLLVGVVLVACGMLPFGSGSIAQLILQGPLMGGLYLFYLRLSRSQPAGINDAFSGFGPRFVNLMLTHVVTAILAGLSMIPAAILFVIWWFKLPFRGHGHFPGVSALTSSPLFVPMLVLGVIGICISQYLTVCWTFALPLAADKSLRFQDAMRLSRQVVQKRWWMTFGFVIVSGLIGAVGILACCVGIIFTMPITIGMLMFLYKRNFDDLTSAGGAV